jgi:glycosyltransferase involved in cell wall biosynthesis
LPTGIDAQRYISDQTNTEFPGIFHLGSLDWEPNIEGLRWFLSEVWPKVLSQNDRLKLHIAGRNASEKLKDFFSAQANVVFEGEVADANAYINSKSIMIVPLLSGSGMRIKVIEGMALTKAIVSTSVGCEGITAIDGKDMMIADKPELFAEKLLALAQDKKLCQSISVNARLYIEQTFDNHSIVSRLVQKYTDFIQQHSRKKPI